MKLEIGKYSVYNLNIVIYEYAKKYELDPKKFRKTFEKRYINNNNFTCEFVHVKFDVTKKLDKSLLEFMEIDTPLGETITYVLFMN